MRQSLMGVATWPATGSGRGTWPTAFLKTPSRNSQGWADGNGGPNGTERPWLLGFSASGVCPGGPGLAQSITATPGLCSKPWRACPCRNCSRWRRNLDGSGINLIGTIPQPRTHERSKFHYALHNDRRGGSWRVIPSTWLWFANGGRPSIPPLPGSCALRTVGKSQNRLWAFPLPPSPPDLHLPDFTAIPRHFRFSSHPSQTERERDDHRREIPRPCVTLPKRREITVAMPMQGPSSAQSSWGFSAQESSRRRSSPCRLGAENEHTQVGPRQANNLGSHLLPGNPLVPEKFQTLHTPTPPSAALLA
jgi:hypothetical protein